MEFCPIPVNTKEDDKCANPYCRQPMKSHYRFGRDRTKSDDESYERYSKLWSIMERELRKPMPLKGSVTPDGE